MPEQPLQPIDFLYQGLERNPAAVAVETLEDRRTYAELVSDVESLATALQQLDPSPGSRVGTCAWNTLEHLTALLATYAAGKVWVPLNPRNGNAELKSMIAATRPGIIVADESCLDRISPSDVIVILGHPSTEQRAPNTELVHPNTEHRAPNTDGSVAELIDRYKGKRPVRIERSAESDQVIKFSGGSTGRPKAIVQPVRCINAQADAIGRAFEFHSKDVNLVAAPITHGTSCFILPILAAGGRHVLLGKSTPPAILDAFDRFGVTTVYMPPTLIYMLLEERDRIVRAHPHTAHRAPHTATSVESPVARQNSYPALRHLIYSAAPMPPERIRQVRDTFGPVLETAYGQVEVPQIVTAMRAADFADARNLESVGQPVPPVQVAIMDRDGGILKPGETGEVVVRGDLVMTGYLGQPALTAETIIDGWLHTGDLGVIDERGYLYLKGRTREVIISGGFNVFPADVESVLCRHPAVGECSVFGMEDPKWGEAVHAAVSLRVGAKVTEEEIITFMKKELDSVKAPKRVHFVDRLPHNAAGKVSRKEVKELVGRGTR